MTMMSLMRRLTAAISIRISAEPIQAAPAMPRVEISGCPVRPRSGAPSRKIATPRLAPELMPSTYGPASGLRKRVCICRPLTARAAPASRATTAFSRRMFRIIFVVTGSFPLPVSAARTSRIGMGTAPTERSTTKKYRRQNSEQEKRGCAAAVASV